MSRSEPSSPWWLSGTPLASEHHKLMQRRQKPIPWDQANPDELTAEQRQRVGRTWMKRSEAEYLAISTFAVLTIDLAAAAAPADVMSLCNRAAIDEIRHAELCLRMASIYLGQQKQPAVKMSTLPDDPKKSRRAQAIANTLLVSCASETYATTILCTARDQSSDPVTREVLTAIYSDEVQHARLGWSYLRYCIDRDGQRAIDAAAEMVPIAIRGVANVVETPRPNQPIPDVLRKHSIMLPAEERVVFSSCVREVIVPGFEALGIPTGDVAETYGDEWAAQPPPEPDPDAGELDYQIV